MKKVNVILPAYNGEQYIGEQIESLLKQTYGNVDIYIRDDHSKDGTLEVIRSYIGREPEGKRIILIDNENTNWGYVRNVFDTWKLTRPADYYCFCDQDDVWHSDKIEKSVKLLESQGDELPALCFTGFYYCDSELNRMRESVSVPDHPDLRRVAYDFLALNFNITVNHAFRDAFFSHLGPDGHYPDYPDYWMSHAAASYGRLFYLNEKTVEYRRNEKAASYANHSALSLLIWRIRMFFRGKEPQQIARHLKRIRAVFGDVMSENDRRMMDIFTQKTIVNYFRRLFYPRRLRSRFVEEIELRILFMFGKFW